MLHTVLLGSLESVALRLLAAACGPVEQPTAVKACQPSMARARSMGAYLLQGDVFLRTPVLLQVCCCLLRRHPLLCRPLLCYKLACLGSSKLALQAGHQLLQHANSPCRRDSLSVPG